jgi:predicted MFS family arabinose efflux permease
MKNLTLEEQFKKLSVNILILVAFIALISSFSLVYIHVKEIEPNVLPEINKKTEAVGHSLVKQLERALDLGIPLDQFKGMNLVFKSIMNDNKDIASMIILSPDEKELYKNDPPVIDAKNTEVIDTENAENILYSTFPIAHEKNNQAILKVGIDKQYVTRSINSIIYDIATILAISLLIAAEVIFFFIRISLSGPIENLMRLIKGVKEKHIIFLNDKSSSDEIGVLMKKVNAYLLDFSHVLERVKGKFENAMHQLQSSRDFLKLNKRVSEIKSSYVFDKDNIATQTRIDPRNIRTPIFLFIFCETLTISFLPTYGYQLYTPLWGIPKEILASAPISIFMLAFAFFTPLTGFISERRGIKKTFILGTLISVIGYFMCAFASTMSTLIIARAISAMGYAFAFTASQALLAACRNEKTKIDTSSIFLFAFGAATLCGAPVGGILADNIGYSSTFILSGVFSALSAMVIYIYISEPSVPKDSMPKTSFSIGKLLRLMKDPLFSGILFLCALPARIMFGGFLFFLAPLYLLYLGNTQSTIGRVTMIYGLTIYITAPLISKLINKKLSPLLCAVLGSILIGLSAGGIMYFRNTSGVILSITLFALGHIMQMSSSMHIIFNYSNAKLPDIGKTTVIGVYNSIERYGAVIGPILMGLFISLYSYVQAVAIVGMISLVSSVMMVILYLVGRKNVLAHA